MPKKCALLDMEKGQIVKTHTDVIRSLPASVRSNLTQRTTWPGVVHLAGHLGLISFLGVLIALGVPGWQAMMLPQGIAIIFLFTLHHETIHRTVFANDRLNDIVARGCGLIFLMPSIWFRYFHLAHHRYTQDPDNDPELQSPKPSGRAALLWHLTGINIWTSQISVLFHNALGRCDDTYVPAKAMRRVQIEAVAMLGFYAALIIVSVAFQTTLLVWIWIVPALIGQPFLRVYLLAEHGQCSFFANMLVNTRTTYTNKVVRFLAWNMPYHIEHHSQPSVPFNKLPELHRLMQADLGVTADGYIGFSSEYLAGMKNS
jgi:fatty acid desaturase